MRSAAKRRAVSGAAWLAACGVVGCAPGGPAPIRHVVLVSLDTMRADHLGCYGAERAATPNLDRLAASGVVFERAVAPAPTTLAAHTSIMTGTYPQTHGVGRNGFLVHDDNEMLAEVLARHGFHTAGFLGSFALESRFAFAQGFDHFDERFEILIDGDRSHDQNQRRAASVTDAVLAHVERHADERLFLFAHYFDPHQPYDPPAPYGGAEGSEGASLADVSSVVTRHHRRLLGETLGTAAVITQGLPRELVEAQPEPRRRDRRMAELYAGEVAYLDEHVGRLLDGLERAGILDEALVIVTADHGETFWEHGDLWNHGLWVYDTTVHVPLIVRLPGDGPKGRSDAVVSTIDLVPTVCELLGIPAPARTEGVSLVPALTGEAAFERPPVFSQATQPARVERPGEWRNAAKPRSVRSGGWKYVHAPYLELEQLYDLAADPAETRNLLSESPPPAAALEHRDRLRALLDAWSASADPLPSQFAPDQLEETRRRLEELGYTGDG